MKGNVNLIVQLPCLKDNSDLSTHFSCKYRENGYQWAINQYLIGCHFNCILKLANVFLIKKLLRQLF